MNTAISEVNLKYGRTLTLVLRKECVRTKHSANISQNDPNAVRYSVRVVEGAGSEHLEVYVFMLATCRKECKDAVAAEWANLDRLDERSPRAAAIMVFRDGRARD